MNRKEMEFTLEKNRYIYGGTKESCVKARDFLHYAMNLVNRLEEPDLYAQVERFEETVKTLMAFAFRRDDTATYRNAPIVYEGSYYLEGGTKKACVIVRDFFRDVKDVAKVLQNKHSCVTANEFVDAVKALVAYAFSQEDTIPETWRCDSDCRMTSYLLCPGECNLNKKSEKQCPFFMDESYI